MTITRIWRRIRHWLDRATMLSEVRAFARAGSLTPIEIAAVCHLVRVHFDAHLDVDRARNVGIACVLRIANRHSAATPCRGIVIHLPRCRIGGRAS